MTDDSGRINIDIMNNTSNNIFLGERRAAWLDGLKDGIPVALGYFVVSFSLGINAVGNGITPFQSMLTSLLCNSSSGEYAGFTLIGDAATYIEIIIMILIINARYLLMGAALSQRIHENTPVRHRFILSFDINDELFGLCIRRPGYLNPFYPYGIATVCIPAWAAGTACGGIAGNVMPVSIVSACSVALYGMFLAIIIPPIKGNKIIGLVVAVCFVCSYAGEHLPVISDISSGTRLIILTLILASAAAIVFPVKEEDLNNDSPSEVEVSHE